MKDAGEWTVERGTGVRVFVASSDFTHDVWLNVMGDFESVDQKIAYAQHIADRLNSTKT